MPDSIGSRQLLASDAFRRLVARRWRVSLFLSLCLCITAVATYLYARKRPEGDAALDPAVAAAAAVTTEPTAVVPPVCFPLQR